MVLVINDHTKVLYQQERLQEDALFFVKGKSQNGKVKFGENNIKIIYDYVDTGLAICTYEVLNQFMDNFDYQKFNEDFVNDLLNSEILDLQVSVYSLKSN